MMKGLKKIKIAYIWAEYDSLVSSLEMLHTNFVISKSCTCVLCIY